MRGVPVTCTYSGSRSPRLAQHAIADGDPAAAVAAASEALELQEQIGYTEGTVSALHVLGQAHRLGGNLDAARDLHRRALTLASRIGHAAAMCEAMEDLARTEATSPAGAGRHAAPRRPHRTGRSGLPLRQRDAEELRALEDEPGRELRSRPSVRDRSWRS